MFVDYESIEEFDALQETLIHKYKTLVTEIAYQDSTYDTHPMHEDSPMANAFEKGLSFWLSFTKNQQQKFCEIQSNTIAFALFNIIKNYREFCTKTGSVTDKHKKVIKKMLLNTIDSYFGNEEVIVCVVSANSYLNIGEEIFHESFVKWNGQFIPVSKFKELNP